MDTDDSSSKDVKVTFVVKESDGSSTPTVAISDDKDVSGSVSIPEAVTHNGVEYKQMRLQAVKTCRLSPSISLCQST